MTVPSQDESGLRALPEQAVTLAANLLRDAEPHLTTAERRQAESMARMMNDPEGKRFTLALADQVFRCPDHGRSAETFIQLIARHGIPRYLRWWERLMLKAGVIGARVLPSLAMPAVMAKVRWESKRVILPGEPRLLHNYVSRRRSEGTRLNINQLGEAILGEAEAKKRLDANLALLEDPDVNYVSVKISSIFSQISVLAFEQTMAEVKERLRLLCRAAMIHRDPVSGGPKFVNLDMEEYRDLHLTLAVFTQLLDEEEFRSLSAGIVLQAYLPDAVEAQRKLVEWARRRVDENSGAPIKLRIVKGANLAMEQVEAATHGWPQAPYNSKHEVDANYKRMLEFGMQPDNARCVRIGVASHNLFDIAYALLLRDHYGVAEFVEFEMLEGMANHQAEVVRDKSGGMLFYAPIVRKVDFVSAIAYLVRRLDENTASENFLRDLFGLKVGSTAWKRQRDAFLKACRDSDEVPSVPNRTQNRRTENRGFRASSEGGFENEPDTDWALSENRFWLAPILDHWQNKEVAPVPLQIAGRERLTELRGLGRDPSRPDNGVVYEYSLADASDIDQALDTAVRAGRKWERRSVAQRRSALHSVASRLAEIRGDAIGCMALDAGKAVAQSDPEISEAIDFANYYANGLDACGESDRLQPVGPVVIAPPWNFPFAIPAGGVLAALMAGNPVVLKPAPETVLTAWILAKAFWDAGVPRDVLQFIPCPDNEIGRALITDERVGAVVLTGAHETARMFLGWKPDLRLFAETSGKNALVITSAADVDLAVRDLVYSAFGHSGQKCSAASLAIVEDEIYDTESFRRQLRDAAASLPVGSAWDLRSVVTPIVRSAGAELLRGLTQLDEGEKWLLEPRRIHETLWTPGIRMGVKPGSWYHRTECFGPVLGVMRVRDLDEALAVQNNSRFGLTAGIHSLDRLEIKRWREQIQAGNVYTNRMMTGAVVRRQPFGGWKDSCVGPGYKAGGPHYVVQFTRADYQSIDFDAAEKSYAEAWEKVFSREHDPSEIHGERNVLRYRSLNGVILLGSDELTAEHVALARLAASLCGTEVTVVSDLQELNKLATTNERLRVPVGATAEHFARAYETGLCLDDAPLHPSGLLELPHWLREQSVSDCLHRYGNIVE